MVKFSKQFEAQLVPEWKEAFVDYYQLKKDLKKLHLLLHTHENEEERQRAFPNPFCSLKKLFVFRSRCPKRGAIQVHKKLSSSGSKGDLYETELGEQLAENEGAKEFFRRLDEQVSKVNQFYRAKEKEFADRGESLKKQLEILLQLKAALRHRPRREKGIGDSYREDDHSVSVRAFSCDEESSSRSRRREEEQEQGVGGGDTDQSSRPPDEELGRSMTVAKTVEETKLRSLSSSSSFSSLPENVIGTNNNCHQGRKSLRIHIPMTNPSRAFSAITYLMQEDDHHHRGNKKGFHINKAKLRQAEKMIRGAFIELYKGLGYLKTYRNLNMLAFVKILKKFDKVTNKQVLPIYIRVVESTYFNSSDKILRLADEVEEIFIKQFADNDRRKAMKYLKPTLKKDSHVVTFFIGLFTGCFIALLVGYLIMAHITGMYRQPESNTLYMETVYPVLSMFSLLFLHLFMYGCNIVMWRKSRINYSFILELSPKQELKYRDVFLICTTSMSVVVGVLFLHLSLVSKGYSFTLVHSIPGLLLLGFLLLLLCPFNIIYKPSRYRFLRVMRNIILSPLYKVFMLDFFMADQLCSQIPMLRELEYVACYYVTGSYKNQDYGYCMKTKYYRDLAYAVSFLPYYWRAMQCARRWLDEGDRSHIVNLGKYVSAMLAAGAKVAYEKETGLGWLCLVVAISSGATVYQLYWDFVKDWGLLQPHSRNPWLRNELMLHQKFIYYFSMGLNIILRLAWMQTVLHYNFGRVDYRVTGLFLAALEVIRRGQWNFYRLENEHLNNAGKFRAVKTVPLPFHEIDPGE
ncbi:unnamed protein product [Cuscuta campestris]|uniref:SPX domain-containing protein n=1 Tax=Cuscuta campestris TaxID=132261 RepID=A0A484LNF3_9ASTE|nr:unnamed protein product [Cuscuta campestris]